jgi:hypothetical protein
MTQQLQTPAELLSTITSALNGERAGEILVRSGESSAKMYFNGRDVLWAFAAGQKESFQTILLRENWISRDGLVEGIKGSRESGKRSLEEILIYLGVNDPAARRNITLRHTKSALQTLLSWQQTEVAVKERERSPNLTGFTIETLLGRQHGSVGKDVPQILDKLRSEIPFLIATAVIDGKTGMPVAAVSDSEALDVEAASAFYRDLLRSSSESLSTSKSDAGEVQEILITARDRSVLLFSLQPCEHLLYLLLQDKANIGMARVVAKRNSPALIASLT